MASIKSLLGKSANENALNGLSKLIAVIIVLIVAAFGDVMYIIKMQQKFPQGGVILVMCYLGALMSFFAIGYLLLGKTVTFKPGPQLLAAWVVFGMELVILTANILIVFDGAGDTVLSAWAYIAPATPVLHMIGVAMIFFLDPELKNKHKDQEMEDKKDQLDREYAYALHNAKMEVKMAQIDHTSKALMAAVNSADSIRIIQEHGARMNANLLSEMTGQAVGYAAPQIVAAAAPNPVAQVAQVAHVPMPVVKLGDKELDLKAFLKEYEAQKEAEAAQAAAQRKAQEEAEAAQAAAQRKAQEEAEAAQAAAQRKAQEEAEAAQEEAKTQAPLAQKRGRGRPKKNWDIYSGTGIGVGVDSQKGNETNA